MKGLFSFDDLQPKAREYAVKVHIKALRHYHRELIMALLEFELRKAGYPHAQVDLQAGTQLLTLERIKVTGSKIEPELLERLVKQGVTELAHQCSNAVIEEDIRAEGFKYFDDGTLAWCRCPSGSCRYYDGSIYVGGDQRLMLNDYLEQSCDEEQLTERTRPFILETLATILSRRRNIPLDDLDILKTIACIGWNDKTLQNQ